MFHPVYARGVLTSSPGLFPIQYQPPAKLDSEGKVDAVVQQHQTLLAMVVMAGAKQLVDKKVKEPQQQPSALVEGTLEIVEVENNQPQVPKETGEEIIKRKFAEMEQRGTEVLAAQKGPRKKADRNMSIIAGVITLVVLTALAAGLAQYFVGFDKLGQTPITIAQGLEFIGLPVLGGIILIALVMRWTPQVVSDIKLSCQNRRIAQAVKRTKY